MVYSHQNATTKTAVKTKFYLKNLDKLLKRKKSEMNLFEKKLSSKKFLKIDFLKKRIFFYCRDKMCFYGTFGDGTLCGMAKYKKRTALE